MGKGVYWGRMSQLQEPRIFKISLRSHLHSLKGYIASLYTLIVLLFLLSRPVAKEGSIVGLLCMLGFFILVILLGLWLHIEYYLRNKGQEFCISNRSIIFSHAGNASIIDRESVAEIRLYATGDFFDKARYVWPFSNYHFAEIITKDGATYYITSIMGRNIGAALRKGLGLPVKKRRFFFCTTHLRKWVNVR